MKLHPITKNSSESREPTQIDMDIWKEMICSISYGTHSQMLADEITTLARRLATDTITYQPSSHADLFHLRKKLTALHQ